MARRGPRTPQEEMLCALFAEVLGLERVGIDDNFFELGGDSIVSIQLVSRARKAGLVITPRAVFQHPTVSGSGAAVAAGVEAGSISLPDMAVGELPPTPIMRWLLERGGPIDRFNQSTLLRVPAGLQEDHLIGCAAGCSRSSRWVAPATGSLAAEDDGWSLEVAPPAR